MRQELREIAAAFEQTMLFADPPEHTRLRNLVSKAFTPRMIEEYRERIAEIVEEILERAESARRLDVIRDLAYPLPVTVIAEILGVPSEDREAFKRWSDDLAVLLDPFVPAPVFERAQESALEMHRYLRAVFAERRRHPQRDLISRLVLAEEHGDLLTRMSCSPSAPSCSGAARDDDESGRQRRARPAPSPGAAAAPTGRCGTHGDRRR